MSPTLIGRRRPRRDAYYRKAARRIGSRGEWVGDGEPIPRSGLVQLEYESRIAVVVFWRERHRRRSEPFRALIGERAGRPDVETAPRTRPLGARAVDSGTWRPRTLEFVEEEAVFGCTGPLNAGVLARKSE